MPTPSQIEKINEIIRATKMSFEARAREDIVHALNTFKELKTMAIQHVFPDGEKRLCFSLNGTLPVNYRGATYHIPIALYLMDNHPYRGPICYVRPTATMQIRVSETVDDKGRIYLPYLTEWRYPGYDTHSLLQVMTIAFQDKCPVYSMSGSNRQSVASISSTNPPYPVAAAGAVQYPNPSVLTTVNTPYPMVNSTQMPISNSYMLQQTGYGMPTSNTAYGVQSQTNSGAYQPPYQPFVNPNRATQQSTPPLVTPNISTPTSNSTYKGNTGNYGTIQSTHIRASLISAVEDKIRNRLLDKIGTPFAELQSVDINLQELRTGQQKLREMLEKMEQEQKHLDIVLVAFMEKKLELEKALETCANTKGDSSIDNAIDATTPLHRQITRCYVQDSAIDDTIYFLGQALKKGTINLQTYLKYVRQLSRKQFIERATIQKCRLKANLPI